MNPTIYFVVAIVLLLLVMVGLPKERFQPEFLDKRQDDKTMAVEDSSYAQQTNHMSYAPYSMGPIQGMETPFQVNQYRAYVV